MTTNMTANHGVIVWEWLDEHGRWRPYEPHVSDFVEQEYTNHQTKSKTASASSAPGTLSLSSSFTLAAGLFTAPGVSLGTPDPNLSAYYVDFDHMQQLRPSTGIVSSQHFWVQLLLY